MKDRPGDGENRTLAGIVVLYVVMFAAKLTVYFYSGVMALLAESFHTLSDLFISGFLLISLIWSRKGPDESHRYGHGRAQYAAALVAATVFISFTGIRLYEEAISRLIHPEVIHYRNLSVVMIVLIVSIVVAAAPIVGLIREKNRGAAAKAQLLELFNDEMGLIAALIGTLCIQAGHPVADPIASLVVATIIVINAVILFRENLSYLLGKSPEKELLDKITATALEVPDVLSVHSLKAEYIGPDSFHVDLHVVIRKGISAEEADNRSEEVCRLTRQRFGTDFCTVHMDVYNEDLDDKGKGRKENEA